MASLSTQNRQQAAGELRLEGNDAFGKGATDEAVALPELVARSHTLAIFPSFNATLSSFYGCHNEASSIHHKSHASILEYP